MANVCSFASTLHLVLELSNGHSARRHPRGLQLHSALPIMRVPMEHSRVVHRNCRRTSRRLEVRMGNASAQGPDSC